jgi:hypothetical protein
LIGPQLSGFVQFLQQLMWKQKNETSSETTEQKRQKCQTTAIPEAPVPQTSLSQLEDSKKQQSDLGDPEWQPDWWKDKRSFKKKFFDCVGFPYKCPIDEGLKFVSYFDLQKYRKNRAKQRACPPEYKTVVDVSVCIDPLYNFLTIT